MGLIAGVFLGVLGFIHKSKSVMFRTTIKALFIVFIVAFLIGLLGLLYGKLFLLENNQNWFLPKNVINKNRFILVESMHNFSYLGGAIGIVIGAIYSLRQKRR